MKPQILFSALFAVSGLAFSHNCFAGINDDSTASKIIDPCYNYAYKENTSIFRDFASTTTCGVPYTVLMPFHFVSTTINDTFKTHLAQADMLARKSLSGSQITREEGAVLASTLDFLAQNQIISPEAAAIGDNGLSTEQLNLIVSFAGAVQ